ncbi:MAG: acetyltransferase [Myxococcales bacterium]|nr:acetyltransferase [Myxococcales bacterium]
MAEEGDTGVNTLPRVVILGAGGHARVLADALLDNGRSVLAFIDVAPPAPRDPIMGIPVYASDDGLSAFSRDQVELANGIGSLEPFGRRAEIYHEASARGFRFANVIHASAAVSKYAHIGEGAQVLAGAVVQPGSHLGKNTLVNTRASVDHDCHVGDSCHIACGAVLCGQVSLGDGCHVGPGATIIQGIKLASGTMVAAGAVVVSDPAAPGLLKGVPARLVDRAVVKPHPAGGPHQRRRRPDRH